MNQDRRKFLIGAGGALTMTALATQARHFAAASALATDAQPRAGQPAAPPSDYRALVCILLNGGNDGNNTLVPLHSDANISNYQVYASGRTQQGLAIPQNQLLPVSVSRLSNLTYGFHSSLGPLPSVGGINNGIYELWGQGRLAVVANMGSLIRPLTKAQFQQQQSSRADAPSSLGWAGKVADRTNSLSNPTGRVPMITSINGAQLFTLGQQTTPLAIKSAAVPLSESLYLHASCCGGTLVD